MQQAPNPIAIYAFPVIAFTAALLYFLYGALDRLGRHAARLGVDGVRSAEDRRLDLPAGERDVDLRLSREGRGEGELDGAEVVSMRLRPCHAQAEPHADEREERRTGHGRSDL